MIISKCLRPSYNLTRTILLQRKLLKVPFPVVNKLFGLVTPTQYDTPMSKRLQIGYAMRVYWELIPIFVVSGLAVAVLLANIMWAFKNKVDVTFNTKNRSFISRTMDLRNPEIHKWRTVNQKYEPWPEMQDVLDKMKAAEERLKLRAESCSYP